MYREKNVLCDRNMNYNIKVMGIKRILISEICPYTICLIIHFYSGQKQMSKEIFLLQESVIETNV